MLTLLWTEGILILLTVCSRLLHPHVIQFREVFLTERYLAIAMEFAPGGDMFQHVKRRGGLEEAEVSLLILDLRIEKHSPLNT